MPDYQAYAPGAAQPIQPQSQGTPYNPAAKPPNPWRDKILRETRPAPVLQPNPKSFGAYRYGAVPQRREAATPAASPRKTAGVQGGGVNPNTGMWTPGMPNKKYQMPASWIAPEPPDTSPKRKEGESEADFAGRIWDDAMRPGSVNARTIERNDGSLPSREEYVAANGVPLQQRQAAERDQLKAQRDAQASALQRTGMSQDAAQWLVSGAYTAPTESIWNQIEYRVGRDRWKPGMTFQDRVDKYNRRLPAYKQALRPNFFDENALGTNWAEFLMASVFNANHPAQ